MMSLHLGSSFNTSASLPPVTDASTTTAMCSCSMEECRTCASAKGGAGTVVIVSGLLTVRHEMLVESWMP